MEQATTFIYKKKSCLIITARSPKFCIPSIKNKTHNEHLRKIFVWRSPSLFWRYNFAK